MAVAVVRWIRRFGQITNVAEADRYRQAFDKAWEIITTQVEAEVLEMVGLPKVEILEPGSQELASRPAFYDEKTQTIKIGSNNVTASRIQHEFGHHIEEQGPVEIWLGLATVLSKISTGRPLEPADEGSTRELTYGYDTVPKLPRVPYSLSYYRDAGTELLSLVMEELEETQGLLADLHAYVDWSDEEESHYLRQYVAVLLQALRPREMRERGVTNPALL